METNETKIFFDAALEMALRAEIDHELAQTPSPAELKRKYPDTSRWDARLYAALKRQTRHSRMRKRLVMVLLVTALLAAGVFAANAELRHAIYTAVIQWLPTEMHLTYETDGDTLTALPEGFTDRYTPPGFVLDEVQYIDTPEMFFHGYDAENGQNYIVSCYAIGPVASEEIMDNEHTVYTETTVNDKPATLGTSSNFDGSTTYYLFWEQDGVACTVVGNVLREELQRVAENIN